MSQPLDRANPEEARLSASLIRSRRMVAHATTAPRWNEDRRRAVLQEDGRNRRDRQYRSSTGDIRTSR